MKKNILCFLFSLFLIHCLTIACFADVTTRIKDVAKVQGVRANQLMGYGLVIGLNGTGDSTQSTFTVQSVLNMMRSFGILMPTSYLSQLKTKNIAAVVVTAQLPPFFKPGDTIDISVASMGDAKSIQGGTLLQAPLKAANGQVYAVAQGAISLGTVVSTGSATGQAKPFPTNGQIPNGAIVERDVPMQFANDNKMNLALMQPDFTTATRIADAINKEFGNIAVAVNPATVKIEIPLNFTGEEVSFVSRMELLPVTTSNVAKIVINEKTGTIVMGANVTINNVSVAQNGLAIKVGKKTESYTHIPDDSVTIGGSGNNNPQQQNNNNNKKAETVNVVSLPESANVGEVVKALNAIGAKPSDLIAILQAMKAAGAINAEIQVL